MERLAWIGKVTAFNEIPNARFVHIAVIDDAWRVVVKKGDFVIGDLVIYFRVGSILPTDFKEAEFLNGKPLRTKKIVGFVSQGLAAPLSWITARNDNYDLSTLKEGDDVTELMGVIKNVEPEETEVYRGDPAKAHWPGSGVGDFFNPLFPKTDEPRVHGIKKLLDSFSGPFIITKKEDGQSVSIFSKTVNPNPNTDESAPKYPFSFVSVCSRNFELIENSPDNKPFFDIIEEHYLDNKMKELNKRIVIYGENSGPKINGNRLSLTKNQFHVFNIYDLDEVRYLLWDEVVTICQKLGLDTVPVVFRGIMDDSSPYRSIEYLVALADEQKYDSGRICEGIVIKSDCRESNFHGKIISPLYEMKYKL